MKEQTFNNDADFFKSHELTEGGLLKALGHKYVKRTGVPGQYRYWYRTPEGKLVEGRKPASESAKEMGGYKKQIEEKVKKEKEGKGDKKLAEINQKIDDALAARKQETKPEGKKEKEADGRGRPKSEDEFVKEKINAYHGTSAEKEFDTFGGDVAYFTVSKKEAQAYADNPVIGGGRGRGRKRVMAVHLPEGKKKDIDALVQETVMEGGDLDEVIEGEAKKARKAGFEYMTFQHPSTEGEDFTAIVALNPEKVRTEKKLREEYKEGGKKAKAGEDEDEQSTKLNGEIDRLFTAKDKRLKEWNAGKESWGRMSADEFAGALKAEQEWHDKIDRAIADAHKKLYEYNRSKEKK